ncbi:type I-C CRISPR-associated protein Cas8c/Csd1 [Leptospira noguchii]|uniref:type I-C CRISPR-associated protein Cas8c/Csd1 n=1 Tax=Leptospira noguchii TaxID=28182 RepID=UPI00077433A4|nr:type I-C CRISPR-associated protein Cas8c/Csd1 [Leptospira noguchii]
MILQELVKYYERKLEEGEIAREGFETKEIPYLIEIDDEGNFIRFISTWQDEKKKRSSSYTIPKAVIRSSGINANLLWDNFEYIFGLEKKEKQKDFIRKIQDLESKFEKPSSLTSILNFFSKLKMSELKKDPLWNEIEEEKHYLTFKLQGQNEIICSNQKIIQTIAQNVSDDEAEKGICLVSGKMSPIERLHSKLGLTGANTSGANLVSFNLDAFESYGKKQGSNAPTSKYANFAYGTSISSLTSKDSRQKILIGNTTMMFWSETKNELEDEFSFLLKPSDEDQKKDIKREQESRNNQTIKEHFVSPFTGKLQHLLNDGTKFFILGLAPNAARISVRFWYPSTVGEISKNINQHFTDLKLEIPNIEFGFIGLNRILSSTAIQGKMENVNPSLSGKLVTSIISGSEYPRTLLSSILIRLKAEKEISFVRVSVLKAILNRKGRFEKFKNYKELTISMDEENTNVAYRLGRLFAVMERLQERVNPGINATIRDRYFSSASSRPATVFPVLFNLSMHHASKSGSIWFEKLKGEILAPLSGNIPNTFSLEEQGLFAVGYYHQRNALFKKKEEGELV